MGLKETYESWVFRPIAGVGANATPVKQSEGDVSVNFLQDTYQPRKEVNRAPGDTVVTQATELKLFTNITTQMQVIWNQLKYETHQVHYISILMIN